jgi:tRNA threonylcarbamoyladenosine biosynthesis protein TsaE
MTPADPARIETTADDGRQLTTRSSDETSRLGEVLGRALRRGDLVLLRGEIGTGKTTFTKGVAAGLEIAETVVSPTFMLHGIYEGRLTLTHFDFYRLEDASEALILGLDETLDSDGVALVEWADRVPSAFHPPYLEIAFELGTGEPDERVLTFTPAGGDWAERVAGILA